MTLRFTTLRFTTVLLLPCAALNLDDLQRAPIVRRRAALQAAGAALLARPRAAAAKLGEYQYDENRLARDSSALDFAARRWDYLFRPAPPASAGLRERLDRDFAVACMRASYNVADELDFVPMDAFQKDFFLIRQREYQYYLDALFASAGLRPEQGDLTDPSYFDFISYAQYLTIREELGRARTEFDEPILSEDGETTTIVHTVRDDGADGATLARMHGARVGARVLAKLIEKNDELLAKSQAPAAAKAALVVRAAPRPTPDDVQRACGRLLLLMRVSGYALATAASVSPSAGGGGGGGGAQTLELRVTAPATYWSQRTLAAAEGGGPGGALANDFEAKVSARARLDTLRARRR